MSVIKTILQSLFTTMNGICEKTYLKRPKSVADQMNSFIVVSLPVTIKSKIHGNDYNWADTFCRVEIFVRDNGGELRINDIDKFTDLVMAKFPIKSGAISIINPKILLSGDDGNGFDVVTIQALVTT